MFTFSFIVISPCSFVGLRGRLTSIVGTQHSFIGIPEFLQLFCFARLFSVAANKTRSRFEFALTIHLSPPPRFSEVKHFLSHLLWMKLENDFNRNWLIPRAGGVCLHCDSARVDLMTKGLNRGVWFNWLMDFQFDCLVECFHLIADTVQWVAR